MRPHRVVGVTSNSDVSDITDLPSMEIPDDLCEEGEHDFRTDDAGYRYCLRCNRSLQAICDWYGHDTTGGRT